MSAYKPKGYIEERKDGTFLVGAKDGDYRGPVAQVYADRDWLVICTDDYEGNAMLNVEALPQLRRALSKIAKRLKATPND